MQAQFEAHLQAGGVPSQVHVFYKKWFRSYLDFCQKYHLAQVQQASLAPFLKKLQDKRQTEAQQQQASHAISLYDELFRSTGPHGRVPPLPKVGPPGKTANEPDSSAVSSSSRTNASTSTSPDRKTYPVTHPSVSSLSEPGRLTGASWKEEYARLANEILVRHYSFAQLD